MTSKGNTVPPQADPPPLPDEDDALLSVAQKLLDIMQNEPVPERLGKLAIELAEALKRHERG